LLSVGRINVPALPSLPYAGTSFVVGPDLLMTNRHVAQIFVRGVGASHLQFLSGQSAVIDFYHENGRVESEVLAVEGVVMVHPYWDMALLRVRGLNARRQPLALSVADPADMTDREVLVIGYPGYDPRGDEEFQRIQNRIFRGTYYVKRLQPGLLRARQSVESFRREVRALTHDSSTLGGNSGSAVLLLPKSAEDQPLVIGLHFAGKYLVANYAVASSDLAQDTRIVDAGVNFVGRTEPGSDIYGQFWQEASAGDAHDARTSPGQADVASVRLAAGPAQSAKASKA
jgi:V8-like Glu-specific endopeptidase